MTPTVTTTATTAPIATTTTTLTATATASSSSDDVYDEIEIEDMTYDPKLQLYHYPCPCGDRFEIALASLRDGEDIAVCPGCSLTIRVVFELDDLPEVEEKVDGQV